jgi:Zn-finger nucleic acid-binding protein
MLRRPISAAKSTQIDECPRCGGYWLDAWELAELRR